MINSPRSKLHAAIAVAVVVAVAAVRAAVVAHSGHIRWSPVASLYGKDA
jgi:hypothetical protein